MKKPFLFLVIFLQILLGTSAYSQQSFHNNIIQIRLLDSLSDVYSQISIDSAILYHKNGLEIALKMKLEPELIYKMHLKLGILYRKKGDFSKALSSDISALKIAETLSDTSKIGTGNNSIGIDYYRMGEYEKALSYFNSGFTCRSQVDDSSGMADSYYNIGMLYDDMGNSKLCRLFYLKALDLFAKINITDGIADAYNGLAGMYYREKKIDSVSFFALKAFEIYESSGNKEMVSFMSINIANLYNMQGKYTEALPIIRKGIAIAEEVGLVSQLRQGYKALSETYAYMGDYKNAYLNYQTFSVYRDSVFNIEKAHSFDELMAKYQTEKKERLLSQKEAELSLQNFLTDRNRNQRNMFIVLSVLVLIVLSLLLWRYRDKKRMTIILDRRNEELKHTNATKDKFFSIISHDLRSPVSSFQRLSASIEQSFDKIDTDTLKGYISELNRSSKNIHGLLVNLLQWAMSQSGRLSPKKKPIDINAVLKDVITKDTPLAQEKGIRIETSLKDGVHVIADAMMIETVIRNVLSNAIKFSPEGSSVKINSIVTDKKVIIRIGDQGKGMNEEDVKKLFRIEEDVKKIGGSDKNKGAGLGLILCKELIGLNDGKLFVESSSPEGSVFAIELPLAFDNG